MLKKRWAVVCGVCAAAILVRVTTVGASHLNRVQKERLLEEKLEEYEQLKAEYRELARNNDERAYEVGNQAKDLAVVIGQLEKELGVIPDERLEMEIRSIKAGLMDGLNLAKRGGFSEEYIDAIEQYLQEVEAVEREFSQHTRSNAEIRDELDRLHDKWMPYMNVRPGKADQSKAPDRSKIGDCRLAPEVAPRRLLPCRVQTGTAGEPWRLEAVQGWRRLAHKP